MLFIVKVPGHPKPYEVIHRSQQGAQQWAASTFPDSHPACVYSVRDVA